MSVRRWAALAATLAIFATSWTGGVSGTGGSGEPSPVGALMDETWEFRLQEDPLFATQVGDRRYNDRLPSSDPADFQRRLLRYESLLERLRALPESEPGSPESADRSILARLLLDWIAELRFRTWLMPLTARTGFHVTLPQLPRQIPLATVKDYENYIARIEAAPVWVRQNIALMRTGLREGIVPPRAVLDGYAAAMRSQIVEDPIESPLFAPFQKLPARFTDEDRQRLTLAAAAAIDDAFVPAFRELLRFMTDTYYPGARNGIAASELPDGEAFYLFRVRRFTTLERTPAEVHAIGLKEVARIREEMRQVIEAVGFEGDFRQFLNFLRNDPRFYAESTRELMLETAYVLKRMDGELPGLFRRLPRAPYGIREVPEFIAPRATTAYYERPAGDGTRSGVYYVNTHDLPSRPLYEVEALSLHEAVPGHHLQIALQQELEGLHPLRRYFGFTVFIEGWALYAERLGLEVGFYQDPYSDFGRLTYEMWRACRLVVDPGMHALGWTRQQAIDFMAENSALALHNIETEVDRYIGWPGQALAYKTGELEIRALRSRAEQALGARFDVRAFHDVVLGSGAVPLDVLRANVERWIEASARPR